MDKKHGGARKGAGRKILFDNPVLISGKIPGEWLKYITGNRAEWLRDAIQDKIIKENKNVTK